MLNKINIKKIINKKLIYIITLILVIFTYLSYVGVSSILYNEAFKAFKNNSIKSAYEKIVILKFINPRYKDTDETYKKIKALYYIDLYTTAVNKKEFQEALKYLKNADTGFFKPEIIAAYQAYDKFLENFTFANIYYEKQEYNKALEHIKIAKSQQFRLLLDKNYITLRTHEGQKKKYETLQSELYNLEVQTNRAIYERKERFNYLKSLLHVTNEDYISKQKYLIHKDMMLGNYMDTFTLIIETEKNDIKHLYLYINCPSQKDDFMYLTDIHLVIDGKEEVLHFLPSQVQQRTLPLPQAFGLNNKLWFVDTVMLDENVLGNRIYTLIIEIVQSKKTYLLTRGKNGSFKREITPQEKKVLYDMYEYYYYRKKFNFK